MSQSENFQLNNLDSVNVKVRTPKRIIHFSDGVVEEYSDDDVQSITSIGQTHNADVVDARQLTWTSWFMYKAWSAGRVALAACDYMGEGLAHFFGITTPKYWAEIEEYNRNEAEKKEREQQAEGWSEPTNPIDEVQTNQPSIVL
ncbi:hypothetical protein FQA39_LY02013 [Lamprigera yunnana]|nr:hypothetical protein FQA39_LY02013 [Lamprigera yunnana]